MHTKVSLRRRLAAQRRALSEATVLQKSRAIVEHVMGLSAFRTSQTIMTYLALPHEVQTWRLIEVARQQRKRIVVPVIEGKTLVAVELPREEAQLQPGTYGILEPCCKKVLGRPEEIDFVLVPGLAFDRQGWRIGFGRGYYDRFLGQLPGIARYCGLAFSIQIVSYVPRMPYDVCMHYVATEEGIIVCPANSAAV
jgi:5-formyltetrahydrofolate cyclo-ligase